MLHSSAPASTRAVLVCSSSQKKMVSPRICENTTQKGSRRSASRVFPFQESPSPARLPRRRSLSEGWCHSGRATEQQAPRAARTKAVDRFQRGHLICSPPKTQLRSARSSSCCSRSKCGGCGRRKRECRGCVAVAVGVTADVAVDVGVKRTVSSCGRRKGSGRCSLRCRSWRWAKESASA